MLTSEDFGGGHEGALPAGPARHREGHGGDRGLAAAHVTLEQPPHRLIRIEVGEDLVHGLGLVGGQLERQRGDDLAARRRRHGEPRRLAP